MHNFYGKHILADLEEIPTNLMDCNNKFIAKIEYSIVSAGATIVGHKTYLFSPQGYTVFYILKESHVSIHSYPECNSMFLDVFTCGNIIEPIQIVNSIIDYLRPSKARITQIERGINPNVIKTIV